MLKGNLIVVNSTLVRRIAIEKVGGFDETLISTEDWDLWLRLLQSGSAFVRVKDKFGLCQASWEADVYKCFKHVLGKIQGNSKGSETRCEKIYLLADREGMLCKKQTGRCAGAPLSKEHQ